MVERTDLERLMIAARAVAADYYRATSANRPFEIGDAFVKFSDEIGQIANDEKKRKAK